MHSFNIGEAWSLAIAFLRDNLQMLFVIVGGGALISALLQYFVIGGDQAAQMAGLQAAMTSGDFSQLATAGGAGALGVFGGFIVLVAGIISSAAEFAALRIGLTRGQEEVGPALSYGFVAAILTILFIIALVIAAALVIAVPIVLIGGAAAFAGGGGAGVAGIALLLGLVLFVAIIWIAARLSVMQPAMAAARSTNPIYGLTESWRLTRGNALMIVVYFVLLGIAAIVLFLVVGAIATAIGSVFGPLGALILTTVLVSIPLTVLGLAIQAGIYKNLAPDNAADIFA